MSKEGLPFFGLERLTDAFMNIVVGIGALAIGTAFLREAFKPKDKKVKKK